MGYKAYITTNTGKGTAVVETDTDGNAFLIDRRKVDHISPEFNTTLEAGTYAHNWGNERGLDDWAWVVSDCAA